MLVKVTVVAEYACRIASTLSSGMPQTAASTAGRSIVRRSS
jgi:hypothetical protein